MSPRLAPPPSPVVEQVYRHRLNTYRSWRVFRWFLINLAVSVLLLIEVYYGLLLGLVGLQGSLLSYVTIGLLVIFVLNTVVDLARYLHLTFSTECLKMTEKQRRLLAVQENEMSIRTPPSGRSENRRSPVFTMGSRPGSGMIPTMSCNFSRQPNYSPSGYLQHSQSALQHQSANNVSTGLVRQTASMSISPYSSNNSMSTSPIYGTSQIYNTSMSPSSRSFTQPNPSPFSVQPDSFGLESLTLQDSPLRNRFRPTSPKNDVTDMRSLDQLLLEEERREQQRTIRQNEELINPYNQRYSMDVPQFPYQVACRSPQSISALNDDDSTDTFHGEEVWRRLGVSQTALEVWIEKLRRFLSQTIMSRVSKEIRKLNKQLRRLGLEEMEIGEVSIPTLKQIAHTKGHQLQTLNSVVQFLDITSNQQYLVARIHELGKGGCLSDFNWNGGMEYKSKPWAEHLPTDCAIVIHCLCTYLDARLPPHPKFPDGRTFTSQHFLKLPDKPNLNKDDSLIIYQGKVNPPHFKVITGNDIWDVPKGRNNMFQAVLLFLYFVKTSDGGMLDRVSLGTSGINILWVLDEA